jgi:hypothetical protein
VSIWGTGETKNEKSIQVNKYAMKKKSHQVNKSAGMIAVQEIPGFQEISGN